MFNTSSSLIKRFVNLLFLSKYLAYAFICGSFINNSDGRAVLLLPYESLFGNTILLISTLSTQICF